MDADGSNVTRRTANAARDDTAVCSHGGTRIAFASDRTGLDDVFAMGPDGSVETNLTNAAGRDDNPTFAPDGRIAYSSDLGGNYEIVVMNADGTGRVNLTANPAADTDPAFSPDGSGTAFTRNNEIFVMNADGSGQVNLTLNPNVEAGATWSPDGAQIAFHSSRTGAFDIYAMGADGSGVRRLTSHPADEFVPACSPDGSRMLFRTNRDGNDEIYAMNRDGSGQTNLTNAPLSDSAPDWGARVASAPIPRAQGPPSTPTPGSAAFGTSPGDRTTVLGSGPCLPGGLLSPAPSPQQGRAGTSRPASGFEPGSAQPPGPAAPPPGRRPAPSAPDRRPARSAHDPVGEQIGNPERSRFSAFLTRPDGLSYSLEDIGRVSGSRPFWSRSSASPPASSTRPEGQPRRARTCLRATPARVPRHLGHPPPPPPPRRGAAATSVVAGAAMHRFLEPGFPGTAGSDAFAPGMLMGFGVIVANACDQPL